VQALFYFWGMKKYSLLFVVMCLSVFAHAQSFHLGVKAGVNQGSLTKAPNLGGPNTTTSFVCGVFAKLGAAGLFVQPEVLYSQRNGVFSDSTNQTVTNELHYIDVPILVGYKLTALRFYAGPNFQFLLAANQKAPTSLKDPFFSKDNFNSASVGYQIGIGLNLQKIVLDVRYDGSIGDLGKTINTATGKSVNYSTRSNMWQFTIGYRII
jgi:hypothetical protein